MFHSDTFLSLFQAAANGIVAFTIFLAALFLMANRPVKRSMIKRKTKRIRFIRSLSKIRVNNNIKQLILRYILSTSPMLIRGFCLGKFRLAQPKHVIQIEDGKINLSFVALAK